MKLDVVKVWQDLHKMPELGFQEVRTSAYIADVMEKLGYEVTRGFGGTTAVVCYKRGAEPGPTLMLRADMDALPYPNPDGSIECVHACGHDSHCAMLLTAAAELADKVKRGTLKILFQPGEETLKGAVALVDKGILDDVDIALGMHIRPIQDVPAGDMCAAVRHTSSTFIGINIKGRTSHASRPHLGVNCAEAAALITNAVSMIKIDPAVVWSAKVTGIVAQAAAHNIIPDEAQVWLDCRAGTNEAMNEIIEKVKAAAEFGAKSVGATAEVFFPGVVLPAAVYDDDLTAEVAEEIVKAVGKEHLAKDCGGGGEDFHFFKFKKPSIKAAYFGVGVGAAPGLHARNMSFDPQYLPNGVKVLVGMALRKVG
ncbi:MAG: amidohydrolase [Duodenibacillus sp.]|nr:amidohydrolase [Duodenibacillus sp.]HBC69070.1 amidohydrolase [Sutterella sp.]